MIKKVLIFIIMTALLMGCGKKTDSPEHIAGRTYILDEDVSVNEEDFEISVILNFEKGNLNGRFLNSYNSAYKIEGDSIKVSPMATTLMGGPIELMKKESEYFKDLTSAHRISLDGKTLTITTVTGKDLVFKEI